LWAAGIVFKTQTPQIRHGCLEVAPLRSVLATQSDNDRLTSVLLAGRRTVSWKNPSASVLFSHCILAAVLAVSQMVTLSHSR